jgi:uncharacterized protein YrrD
MRKRKDLEGLAVVDLAGGKKLGTLRDLVVSPDNGRVVALTMGGGFLGGDESYVTAADVRAVGPDAVTVESEHVARAASEMPEELRAAQEASRALHGKKVVTENGAFLGTVSDYLIDESAMRVTGLTIGGGLLSGEDAIAADRIVSLGPDAVIVTDAETGKHDPDAVERHAPWAGR